MSAFERASAIRRRDASTYDADLDLGWSIGGRPNGGYLMAVLARAGLDATSRAHPLAVSGHFLRPPLGGAAEIRVDVEEHRSVWIVQAIRDRQADVGVITGETADSSLNFIPYRTDRLVAIVHRKHPYRSREVSFADKSLQYCPTCQTGGQPLADRRLSRLLK